jgi:hypothetical protein
VTIIPVTVNLTVNAPKAKEKEKEFKEKEAFEKNRVKDQKDLFEGGGFGGLGFQSAGVVAPLESQTRSATTGEPLMHFIGQESRPDMAYSALTAESDLNRAYLAAMSARLHGLVANAKQVKDAKDGKDVEKCSEHSS